MILKAEETASELLSKCLDLREMPCQSTLAMVTPSWTDSDSERV
jgi:hypothetical protein